MHTGMQFRLARAMRRLRAHAVALLVVTCLAAAPGSMLAAEQSAINDVRRAELIRLVRQDCGSCHGLTLQGGLGPPLTPDALAGKPMEGLAATILHGRPGTAMPGWRRFVNEAEAEWIVTNLQKGFPDEATGR